MYVCFINAIPIYAMDYSPFDMFEFWNEHRKEKSECMHLLWSNHKKLKFDFFACTLFRRLDFLSLISVVVQHEFFMLKRILTKHKLLRRPAAQKTNGRKSQFIGFQFELLKLTISYDRIAFLFHFWGICQIFHYGI